MKNIILMLLLSVPMSLFAQDTGQSTGISKAFETGNSPGTQSQPAWTFDEMMENLQRVHRMVYKLPYEYDYIKNTLMTQIEAERKKIAPHYPDRKNTGTDHEIINKHFQDWYTNYPDESVAYIKYVEQFVRSQKKTN